MAFEHPGDGALDYLPCRYGMSKLLFRGPQKSLDQPFLVFFGGTETYGRFIEHPFPELIGRKLRRTAVNMGCVNGGLDAYLNDPSVLEIASRADATVIQVMGAQNLSNRFYSVHPRRNDRFIGASALLKTIFRDVDFTEFAFNRHMLTTLRANCPQRFELVVDELQAAWVARMRLALQQISGRKVLLWVADHAPEEAQIAETSPKHDPLYVKRQMLDALTGDADDLVQVVYDRQSQGTGVDGMVFSELEAPAAAETPGVGVHRQTAKLLAPVLAGYLS